MYKGKVRNRLAFQENPGVSPLISAIAAAQSRLFHAITSGAIAFNIVKD